MKMLIILICLFFVNSDALSLESVEKHEQRVFKEYTGRDLLKKSGIACPKCGSELLTDTSVVYPSEPPKYKRKCLNCSMELVSY